MRELNLSEIESVSGGDDERRLPRVVVPGPPQPEPYRPWEGTGRSVGEYLFGDNYGLLIGLDVLAANDALDAGLSGETMMAMREAMQEQQDQSEAENAEEQRQQAQAEYEQFLADAEAYCDAVDASRDALGMLNFPGVNAVAETLGGIFADGMGEAADGFCENR